MELRRMVMRGGGLAAAALLPFVLAFALVGRADVGRGLLLGFLVGLLNSLLLARKLDRVIDGREAWQTLSRTMPRNMLARFALIFAIGAAASRVHGIHLAGLAGGLALYLVLTFAYCAWAVASRWRKEDGSPAYG